MPHDAAYLYLIILLRIYEVGAPISDNYEALGHRCKMSQKRVAEAFEWLMFAGKVTKNQCKIDSPTTHEFLRNREEVLENKKRGAEKRWEKVKEKQCEKSTDAYQMESYLDKDIDKKKIPKKKISKSVLEILMVGGGLTEQTANDVLDYRKAKKVVCTERAIQMLAKQLFDWGDPETAAATMIRKNWTGCEPKWLENLGMKRPVNGHTHPIAAAPGVFVKRDTPQWDAWSAWWRAHKGKSMPGNDGWRVPSEWPPA